MPYRIENRGGKRPWKIVNKETGAIAGSSTSKAKAEASARARMAGEHNPGWSGSIAKRRKSQTAKKSCGADK